MSGFACWFAQSVGFDRERCQHKKPSNQAKIKGNCEIHEDFEFQLDRSESYRWIFSGKLLNLADSKPSRVESSDSWPCPTVCLVTSEMIMSKGGS